MTVAKLLKHDFAKGDLKLYNSNGNVTYYETSNGAWYKYKYNSNGNQTYYEDSKGYWYKYKFDSNGKRIYYENSKGDITDNRPKANSNGKTVIIDGIEYELKEKNQ